MKSILLVLTITLLISTVAFSAPELTDSESKKLFEKIWNSSSFNIKLGDFTVLYENPEKRIISPETSREYYAYAKTGVISIVVKQRTPMLLGEYIDDITVKTTAQGDELAQKWGLPPKPGWFRVKQGNFQIDKIIKNEAHRKGADDYRVIMATYKAQWTPEFKHAMEIQGRQLANDRKAIILFKYDPFKSEWLRITWDVANRDEEFETNDVSKMLSQ